MAALVGIRKLFDYGIFTQHDLKWLDDLMPESAKKKKEDAKRKRKQKHCALQQVLRLNAGNLEIDIGLLSKILSECIEIQLRKYSCYKIIKYKVLYGNTGKYEVQILLT